MVKKKIVYVFGNGDLMIDKNNYKTITQAKNWAIKHNNNTKAKKKKIINIKWI